MGKYRMLRRYTPYETLRFFHTKYYALTTQGTYRSDGTQLQLTSELFNN